MARTGEAKVLPASKQSKGPAPSGVTADQLLGFLECMEPGLLIWDDNGRCAYHSDRLVEILGVREADISVGISRDDFLAACVLRGELTENDVDTVQHQFSRSSPFQFDQKLRNGRVVSIRTRPYGAKGHVVTFTDVTNERRKSQELDDTIRSADEARMQLAMTLEVEKNRQYEAGLLNDFGDWLQSCKSLDELYQVVKRYLEEKLPGSHGELYIYSNSRDALEGVLSWGSLKLQDHIHADSCWGLRRGRSYRFNNDDICFECAHVSDIKHLPIEEYTCIPVVAHGDTVGLLHVRYSASGKIESQIKDPSRFAAKCGELVSLAIANVRLRDELHEQSTRDSLTGLRNRRFCIDALTALRAAFLRGGEPFAVISLDVDKFKDFNDSFGHDAGDAVLQCVANTMKDFGVEEQIPCRFGGEEFLVILPNTSAHDAAASAEMLRKAVMGTEASYAGKPLPGVTISCGVAGFPDTTDSIQGLLKEADLALYRAKESGRNCVEVAGVGPADPK